MIRLVTSIFKTFKVRINVMANYSEDLSRTHFKAKVVFIGGLAKVLNYYMSELSSDLIHIILYMAELAVKPVRKITHAD